MRELKNWPFAFRINQPNTQENLDLKVFRANKHLLEESLMLESEKKTGKKKLQGRISRVA